jgi:hypothetical protein
MSFSLAILGLCRDFFFIHTFLLLFEQDFSQIVIFVDASILNLVDIINCANLSQQPQAEGLNYFNLMR